MREKQYLKLALKLSDHYQKMINELREALGHAEEYTIMDLPLVQARIKYYQMVEKRLRKERIKN